MLRISNGPAKPDILCAINELLHEDSQFDRNEDRSAMRENLVRPITIEDRESGEKIAAFSRNASASGIGLITNLPIPERRVAVLCIERLYGPDTFMLAVCRWCKSYGKNWHFSGWQFINLLAY
jgi:hypothetical protein